jgi:hypothetical protein
LNFSVYLTRKLALKFTYTNKDYGKLTAGIRGIEERVGDQWANVRDGPFSAVIESRFVEPSTATATVGYSRPKQEARALNRRSEVKGEP